MHLHRKLWRELDLVSVYRGPKHHTLFIDPIDIAETEHLKTTRICKDGFLPSHKAMQPSKFFDDLWTRSEHEVKGIAQQNLNTQIFQLLWSNSFHRPICATRHKYWRLHDTMAELELP